MVLRTGSRGLLAILGMLVLSGSARAQTGQLPIYVSDQFKSVARNASQQLLTLQVAQACPDNKPLCEPVLAQLGSAVGAALSKDEAGLQRSLNAFFIQSSAAGLMEFTLGDLADTKNPEFPELATALAPVVRCLGAAVLAGQRNATLPECTFSKTEVVALKGALNKAVCDELGRSLADTEKSKEKRKAEGAACVRRVGALTDSLAPKGFEPARVARALQPILEREPFQRMDLAIYLGRLGDFLEERPEKGLFDATHAFLTRQRRDEVESRLVDRDFDFFGLLTRDDDVDKEWRAALEACGYDNTEPYEKWLEYRNANLTQLRADLLLGRPLALEPLKTLRGLKQCTGSAKARRELARLRGHVHFILSPLELQSAIRRFGSLGLMAAALLDFVGNSDLAQLELSLKRALVFGTAQMVAHQRLTQRFQAEAGSTPAPEALLTQLTVMTPGDVLETCEFQDLHALLGLPFTVDAGDANGSCFRLQDNTLAVVTYKDFIPMPKVDSGPGTAEALARSFAELAQLRFRQRNPSLSEEDAERFLGAVLLSQDKTRWDEIRAALVAVNGERGDLKAREQLQKLALELGATLTPAPNDPQVYPKEAAALLVGKLDAAKLEAIKAGEVVGNLPDRRLDVLAGLLKQREALASRAALPAGDPNALSAGERATLELLNAKFSSMKATQRVRATVELKPEERAVALFKTLRGVLLTVAPEEAQLEEQAGFPFENLVQAVQDGMEGRNDVARKALLRLTADFLVAQVDPLTVRLVGLEGEKCLEETQQVRSIFQGVGLACSAHLLIQSAYHPIADFFSESGWTAPGAARLADTTYREMLKSPYLATAPIILNVGLGASWMPGDDGAVFLTVIDKFGVAFVKYNAGGYTFEFGPFVGGFLDALARTIVDEEQRYWLAGGTLGFSRMWDADFGVQAHVAAAMPFSSSQKVRFVTGLTVVVPFSAVFKDDDSK